MDEAIDQAQKEVYLAGDEITKTLSAHKLAPSVPTTDSPAARHPRFQNVDPTYAAKIMSFVPSPNPYSQPAEDAPPTVSAAGHPLIRLPMPYLRSHPSKHLKVTPTTSTDKLSGYLTSK